MRANEFRVGTYWQVEGKEFCLDGSMLAMLLENGFSEINPIPFTTEWIYKFGGRKDFQDNIYLLEVGCFIYTFEDDGTIIEVHCGSGELDEGFSHIKYVHQFQNLVFAMTNEELRCYDKDFACEHKSITGGGLLNGDKKHCLDCGKQIE